MTNELEDRYARTLYVPVDRETRVTTRTPNGTRVDSAYTVGAGDSFGRPGGTKSTQEVFPPPTPTVERLRTLDPVSTGPLHGVADGGDEVPTVATRRPHAVVVLPSRAELRAGWEEGFVDGRPKRSRYYGTALVFLVSEVITRCQWRRSYRRTVGG